MLSDNTIMHCISLRTTRQTTSAAAAAAALGPQSQQQERSWGVGRGVQDVMEGGWWGAGAGPKLGSLKPSKWNAAAGDGRHGGGLNCEVGGVPVVFHFTSTSD